MANPTTNYGFVMPTPTDLVTDLPADFEVFGQDVDSQMKTNADAATQKATLTTTGDIYYASSASTPARLGIGTDAQVLSVVSGVPAWSNSTAFEPMLTAKIAGQYIKGVVTSTLFTATANTTYYCPIFLPTFTADRIGFRTGAGSLLTSGLTRLGIYNCNLTTGKPSTVLLDAGTVNTTGASTDFQITISQSITAGWYFMAFNTVSTWQPTSTAGSVSLPFYNVVGASLGGVTLASFTESGITGAFATAGTLTSASTQIPMVGLRVA